MSTSANVKLRRADERVTRERRRLEHVAREAGLDEQRTKVLETAATTYGTAVASLCIEAERMAESATPTPEKPQPDS